MFRIAEIKLYNHKCSNKIYSNFQKLFLLVYKQFRKFTYEELLTDLESNSELKTYLGFKKLPYYTTISRFAKGLSLQIIELPKKVAIDATGITLDNASLHYYKRIILPSKKQPFLKATFIADIERYLILLPKLRKKKKRHDVIDAKPMIKKFAKHYEPEIFFGDRRYDDEKIFKVIFENLYAYPLILQCRIDINNHR